MLEDTSVKRRSLCRVVDYNGVRWLKRLGDIDIKGKITTYDFDSEKPMIFENRNRIFWKDGPKQEGFVGIWDWNAIPNLSSPDKDYIESHYDVSESPIEIIEISKAYSIDELVKCLKEGVPVIPMCEKVMFVHKPFYGKYEAVLCNRKMLEINNVYSKLKNDVASLDVYYFDEQAVFSTKTQEFYKYMNIGVPDNVILTKSHVDIIKEVIIRYASWSVAKQNGLSKSDWKSFKDFIGNLSDESLYQEIAKLCNCSKAEAKKYLDDFILSADNKMEADDIDRTILAQIIENNTGLRCTCEKLVEENWKKSNQEKIRNVTEELERVKKELVIYETKKKEVSQEIDEEKKQLAKILEDVEQYETLGNSVKAKVQEKIEAARKDVAEFISQIAMFSPALITASNSIEENAYVVGSECYDGEISSYNEALDSIVDEMGEAGVEGRYITSLATYIYSAYTNHAHLLLAGPNGESIANAFSVGLFGKYAGVLDCNQKYNRQSIVEMLSSDDQVVIIKNPFDVEWNNEIMNLLTGSSKFYFLLNVFAEDVAIEPKGIFNYVLPLFTEIIVNDVARNRFVGKKQSMDFEKYDRRKEKPLYGEFLKIVNAGRLLSNRIQRVLTDLHYLDKDSDNTIDYMYIFFPYGYVTRQGLAFAEKINTDKAVDDDKKEYMLKYLGEN